MAEQRKPIKRSAELAPLSREYHEGLLAVWKIRQGLQKNIEPARIAAFVQWFSATHLQPHFEKEEIVFPRVLSRSHSLITQMIDEHAHLKKLVIEIAQHADLKKLETLAQTLYDHIRFEERQLFGEVEKAATPEQLKQLSETIHGETKKENWPDAFWMQAT